MAENTGKIVICGTDAYLVVDGEGDFALPDGKLYCAGVPGEVSEKKVIAKILDLNKRSFGYRAVTEDDHPDGHIEFSVFGIHCASGTSGQLYLDELIGLYRNADERLIKGDDIYVVGNSVGTSREFNAHVGRLRRLGIKRIFIVGWAYTHCVGESAIAYAQQWFDVYVVRDATRSVSPPHGDPEKMAQKLVLYGVKEITMADIE